jgi:hypothetical protein
MARVNSRQPHLSHLKHPPAFRGNQFWKWCLNRRQWICMLTIPHDPIPSTCNPTWKTVQQGIESDSVIDWKNFWCSQTKMKPSCETSECNTWVLHSENRMSPDRVCTVVVACCILHNIAIDNNEPFPDFEDDGPWNEEDYITILLVLRQVKQWGPTLLTHTFNKITTNYCNEYLLNIYLILNISYLFQLFSSIL